MKRILCRLLHLCPLDELYAARAEAELLREQLDLADAALAIARMQAGRWHGPMAVMRVERTRRDDKELN